MTAVVTDDVASAGWADVVVAGGILACGRVFVVEPGLFWSMSRWRMELDAVFSGTEGVVAS